MQSIIIAIRFTILILLLTGLAYPLAITGISQAAFPHEANGSLLKSTSGQILGSSLVGQNFTKPAYFHSRPSANGYDAANSGGSNLGTNSQKLIDRIKTDAVAYRATNATTKAIPLDAVTASGSGLDPHISIENALAQASRVAEARGIEPEAVTQLIMKHQEQPPFAEKAYVNVLSLNLALDARN